MQSDNRAELSPWGIVIEAGKLEESLALWRISLPPLANPLPGNALGQLALAIFSSREKAEEYCTANNLLRTRLVQFDELQTVRVLLAGYQQGMRYAALDPGSSTAKQLFVLRDVLKAAKQKLGSGDELKLRGID